MTPKEKAEELVRRYMQLRPHPTEDYLDNEDAKLCALIAVDEIIQSFNDVMIPNPFNQYWQEVKQEIENL